MRILGFSLASLCVHAGLVASLSGKTTLSPEATTRTLLSVELQLAERRTDEAPSRTASARTPKPPALTQPLSLSKSATRRSATLAITDRKPTALPEHRSSPTSVSVASSETESAVAPPSGSILKTEEAQLPLGEPARARIRTLLLDDIARRLAYPPIARQRGWGGRVLLSVTIDPQGLLKAIHVAQTSGYDVLDRSAVNTMREIKRLADAQPWLDGGDMEIELPVIYRLHD